MFFSSVSDLHAQFLQSPPLVYWLLSQFVSLSQLAAPQPVLLVAVAAPASLAGAVQVGMQHSAAVSPQKCSKLEGAVPTVR